MSECERIDHTNDEPLTNSVTSTAAAAAAAAAATMSCNNSNNNSDPLNHADATAAAVATTEQSLHDNKTKTTTTTTTMNGAVTSNGTAEQIFQENQITTTTTTTENGGNVDNENINVSFKKRSSDDIEQNDKDDDDDDDSDLFGEEEVTEDYHGTASSSIALSSSSSPARKRSKIVLSKWASRLFDPNRIRGVIQPPQAIPLNDEFLQAFGRREKEFDRAIGKSAVEIDNDLADTETDILNQLYDEDDNNNTPTKTTTKGFTVKVANLKYTTTASCLESKCNAEFGPVSSINLLMDPKDSALNTGRAYITFATAEGAANCVQSFTELDGRPLRVEMAQNQQSPSSQSHPTNTHSATSLMASRYFVARDISKKCFACGQPGHVETDCTNPPQPKPCPLCAMTDHDIRMCPIKAVCFNCGIPGHLARHCNTARRGGNGIMMPLLCTVCGAPGHTKYQCPETVATQFPDVRCMVCHKRGRRVLCCRTLPLPQPVLACWNCGQTGHHVGKSCRRPTMEQLARSEELALAELARAEAMYATMIVSQPPSQQQQQSRKNSRDSDTEYYDLEESNRRRAKSAPPTNRREFTRQTSLPDRYDNNTTTNINNNNNSRGYDRYSDMGGGMPPRHERHISAPVVDPEQPEATISKTTNSRGYSVPPPPSRREERGPPRRQHSTGSDSYPRGGGGGTTSSSTAPRWQRGRR